jgi:hypothetical protein
MKQIYYLIILILTVHIDVASSQNFITSSQKGADISIAVGPGYLYGDAAAQNISTTNHSLSDFAPVNIGLAINVDYTKYIQPGLAYDIALLYSHFKGNEAQSHLSYRGYSFESHVGELSAKIQFEPISFFAQERMLLDPYFVAGVGGVGAYVPTWSFKAANRPNETDEMRHQTFGFSAIGGLGLKFPITPALDGRLEFTFHMTSTDYLDGFHPKASKYNDFFIISLIKISYHLFQDQTFQGYD